MKNHNREKKPWIPRGLYRTISKSNRVQLWVMVISCFVTIFTFWLGLSYQYTIVNNSRNEARKNIHYNLINYVSKYKYDYNRLVENIIANNINMIVKNTVGDKVFVNNYLHQELYDRWDSLLIKAKQSIIVSEKAKYYLPEEQFRRITFNNVHIYELIWEYYTVKHLTRNSSIESIGQFFLLPNKGHGDFIKEIMDSLNYVRSLYINETNDIMFLLKLPGIKPFEGKPLGTWKILETRHQNGVLGGRDEFEKLLVARSGVFDSLIIYMSYNYHILRDEVKPFDEVGAKNEEKDNKVQTGVHFSIASLFIIFPLAFLFWWFILWFIFIDAEKPNKESIDDWKVQKELETEFAVLSAIAKVVKQNKNNTSNNFKREEKNENVNSENLYQEISPREERIESKDTPKVLYSSRTNQGTKGNDQEMKSENNEQK